MKNKALSISAAFLLSGCSLHQINNDMIDNKFLEYTAAENNISGVYTTPMGPSLSTYVINNDGSGVNCYFQNGAAILHKVKIYSIADGTHGLITEAGLKSEISKSGKGVLTMESYGMTFILQPDRNLELANLSCKEKLSGLLI